MYYYTVYVHISTKVLYMHFRLLGQIKTRLILNPQSKKKYIPITIQFYTNALYLYILYLFIIETGAQIPLALSALCVPIFCQLIAEPHLEVI